MYQPRLSVRQSFPPLKFAQELRDTVNAITSPGKGILAVDESTGTIGKRLENCGITNTETNRRNYRELYFRSPGWEKYISGVILYDETLNQKSDDATPLVEVIKSLGVIPGIKVDKGVVPLPGSNAESLTTGIDGLSARCEEYYKQGCRFAKWRCVVKISEHTPSALAIKENVHGLALYAAICQQNGLVPIIEPEVLMDGVHNIEVCEEVTQLVWQEVIKALQEQNIMLEGILLKPNMVMPGAQWKGTKPTPEAIAGATVRVLQRTIPPAVQGILFLSGGQGEEEATINLNAMNKLTSETRIPWRLSFSYGRALQDSAMKHWKGENSNIVKAQELFLSRAKANSLAALGTYTQCWESTSKFVDN